MSAFYSTSCRRHVEVNELVMEKLSFKEQIAAMVGLGLRSHHIMLWQYTRYQTGHLQNFRAHSRVNCEHVCAWHWLAWRGVYLTGVLAATAGSGGIVPALAHTRTRTLIRNAHTRTRPLTQARCVRRQANTALLI